MNQRRDAGRSAISVAAEQVFDLPSGGEVWARVFVPVLKSDGHDWSCRTLFDAPWGIDLITSGVTAMQALCLGLSRLSIYLYASDDWKAAVGFRGRFEGDLGIPANSRFLDRAPYPFTSDGVRTEPGLGDSALLKVVVEQDYVLGAPGKATRSKKVWARIFAPRFEPDDNIWTCAVSVTAPLALELRAVGRTGLQALFGGVAVLSDHLYGSEAYREGRLGWLEPLRSPLLLPATVKMLDVAPYPF